jgi:hypothetical protein
MRKFLHRQQLVKKGLACGKSRRTVEDSPWREALACGATRALRIDMGSAATSMLKSG